jgi:hypothetical protein
LSWLLQTQAVLKPKPRRHSALGWGVSMPICCGYDASGILLIIDAAKSLDIELIFEEMRSRCLATRRPLRAETWHWQTNRKAAQSESRCDGSPRVPPTPE